jgi:uncharacterized protein (DUF924 family)
MSSAVPPHAFTLDRTLFNETLYSDLRAFWFRGIPAGAKASNEESMKRWFGIGRSAEEAQAMDNECVERFAPTLRSIGPEKLALPEFKSYEDDLAHAAELTKPFVDEVEAVKKEDGEDKAAETLLSLILLLDQMPRNIHRDPSGLRLVYGHYDRLAWSLIQGRLAATPGLLQQPYFRGNPLTVMWATMPLMHAEDLKSQKLCKQLLESCHQEAVDAGDEAAAKSAEKSFGPAKSHADIIEQFGRFPHRNEGLGRETTSEESDWLRTGDTFGVKQNQDSDGKGKDEL